MTAADVRDGDRSDGRFSVRHDARVRAGGGARPTPVLPPLEPDQGIDLPGWPDGVLGQQISARGTLDFTQRFDVSQRSGPPAAGTNGGVFVLHGCAYEAAGR